MFVNTTVDLTFYSHALCARSVNERPVSYYYYIYDKYDRLLKAKIKGQITTNGSVCTKYLNPLILLQFKRDIRII